MKKFINFFTLIILFSSSFNISSNQEDIFGDISITSWRNNSFQYTKHGNVSIDTLQFLCGEITQREDFDGTLKWMAPRWIIIYKSSGQIAVRSPTAWADNYTVITAYPKKVKMTDEEIKFQYIYHDDDEWAVLNKKTLFHTNESQPSDNSQCRLVTDDGIDEVVESFREKQRQ